MTAAQIEARIIVLNDRLTLVQGAINRALGISKSHVVSNSKSSKQFENYSLDELRKMESDTMREIESLSSTTGSALSMGAGW